MAELTENEEIVKESDSIEESLPQETEPEVVETNPESKGKPEEITMEQLQQLMKYALDNVKIAETTWRATQKEFDLKDKEIKALYDYNLKHRTECPDDATPEEKEKFDMFNGLNGITEEEVQAIFGEKHPIYGYPHSTTVTHIKESLSDFIFYLSVMREYDNLYKEYMSTVGLQEKANIEELRSIAAEEEDPEKKAKMESSLKEYDSIRTLAFIPDGLSDNDAARIAKAFSDADKIAYYIDRASSKMESFGMPKKVIMELAAFEQRYLGEEYKIVDNMLLMYFLGMIVYAKPAEMDEVKRKASFILIGIDTIVHQLGTEEDREAILSNLRLFEDKMIKQIKK